LARDGVAALAAYATTDLPQLRHSLALARRLPGFRSRLGSWRGRLLANLPWTEYQLYETFLVRAGLFDRFHVHRRDPVVYGNSVWFEGVFDDWDPSPQPHEPVSYFSVVQSYVGVEIEAIATKLRDAGLLERSGG
jgi:hypothetical protein